MTNRKITVDVKREDGDLTRLSGRSAIAVCTPPLAADVYSSQPGTVSLRCDTEAELAWNLASIIASIRQVAPRAYEQALELAPLMITDTPEFSRALPPRAEVEQ